MRYHARLFSFSIGITSSIGWPAGLSAAEGSFTLEETTIADIQEAVAAGVLSSEKLVELIGFAYAYEQASKMRKASKVVPPLPGETINYTTKR